MAQQTISARVRQRRRRRMVILSMSMLLLLGIAYYAYLLMQPPEPQAPRRPPGTIEIPVAARDVPMGEAVLRANLRPQYVSPSAVPPDALVQIFQIAGRVAMRRIPAGAYLKEEDLAPVGAPAGLSGLARPGTRVVVVEASRIGGYPEFLRSGDRVDVLAIDTGVSQNARPTGAAASANTRQGGGTQPGDPNSPARAGRRGQGNTTAVAATLVAEDAEVLQAPAPVQRPQRGRVQEQQLVMQMMPDDAHVTTLALAAGQSVRLVYRPYNDRVRTTPSVPVDKYTHAPRDPRRIEVIYGVTRASETTSVD